MEAIYNILQGLITQVQALPVDSIIDKIIEEDVLGKVRVHEKLVERWSWTSPWFLAPTIVALSGFTYTVYLWFRGIKDRLYQELAKPEFTAQIKKQIENEVTQRINEEIDRSVIKEIHDREKIIKAKPVCLVFQPGQVRTELEQFVRANGFTNVIDMSIKDDFEQIATNTTLVFIDEDGNSKAEIASFIKENEENGKWRKLYYGKGYFNESEFGIKKMHNYANSHDTLLARLYESLTFA